METNMEILFLWVGLIFLWIGVLVIRSARRDGPATQRLEGEVLGYVASGDGKSARTFAPVVAFDHPAAGRRLFESGFGTGNLPHRIGAKVIVLADRSDPTRARLDTKMFVFFGLILAGIGVGCCGLF